MAVQADVWDMAATVSACSAQLRSALASTATLEQLNAVYSLPASVHPHQLQCLGGGGVELVVATIKRAFCSASDQIPDASPTLLQLFGHVRLVMLNDSLRQHFSFLPFAAVMQWAALDKLQGVWLQASFPHHLASFPFPLYKRSSQEEATTAGLGRMATPVPLQQQLLLPSRSAHPNLNPQTWVWAASSTAHRLQVGRSVGPSGGTAAG
jgi:hypothetical protein